MTALDQARPAASPLPERPFVLVTVGTDHHPFDRLVEWVDRWVAARGPAVACVVQYGTSASPTASTGTAYLEHDVLVSAMSRATAVVCHGGPGTILEARAAGHVPIVVPRSKALGEHVDDHQVHFSRRLADNGDVVLVGSADALAEALDQVLDGESEPAAVTGDDGTCSAVEVFEAMVDDAVAQRQRSSRRRRRRGQTAGLDHLGAGSTATAEPASDQVGVLLIAGMGRSGSTLLDRMLGEVEGCVSLGEVVHLWSRGVRDDERCACGERFSRCAFWTAVGEEAFGGWANVDVEAVLAAQRAVERDRHLLKLATRPGVLRGFDADVEAYGRSLLAVYRAVQRLTGARWLVVSSTDVATMYLLRRLDRVDLRIVHLVGDAGARGDAGLGRAASAVVRSLWYNSRLHPFGATGVPSSRVRVRSLVAHPRSHLEHVLDLIEMSDASPPVPEGARRATLDQWGIDPSAHAVPRPTSSRSTPRRRL
ncbi:glycosyltransferase [Euzebya sp.]|uniref:glycosyltransferase n=1 Tax=Euzebya sp. TaxID=1971409 RepID=UPI00351178FA